MPSETATEKFETPACPGRGEDELTGLAIEGHVRRQRLGRDGVGHARIPRPRLGNVTSSVPPMAMVCGSWTTIGWSAGGGVAGTDGAATGVAAGTEARPAADVSAVEAEGEGVAGRDGRPTGSGAANEVRW